MANIFQDIANTVGSFTNSAAQTVGKAIGGFQQAHPYVSPGSTNIPTNSYQYPTNTLMGRFANFQQGVQNVSSAKQAPFQIQVPQIKLGSNPVVNFAANLPGNLAAGIANSPGQTIQGIARTGVDVGKGNFNPKVLASDIAQTAQLPLNVATFGAGKAALKGGEEALSLGSKVIAGAKIGAKYGGGFGALQGLQSGRDVQNNTDYVKNLVLNTGAGAVLGAGLGAGAPLLSEGLSKLSTNAKSLFQAETSKQFLKDLEFKTPYTVDTKVTPFHQALTLPEEYRQPIGSAVDTIVGKHTLGDPTANAVIKDATGQFLPKEFTQLSSPEQANVWHYLLARSNAEAPGFVPPQLKEFDNIVLTNAGKSVSQTGKFIDVGPRNNKVYRAVDSTNKDAVLGKGNYVSGSPEVAGKFGENVQPFTTSANNDLLDLTKQADLERFMKPALEKYPNLPEGEAIAQMAKDQGYKGITGAGLEGTNIFNSSDLKPASGGLSESEVQAGRKLFATLPEKELRRRQDINTQQIQAAVSQKNDSALARLQDNQKLLQEAVLNLPTSQAQEVPGQAVPGAEPNPVSVSDKTSLPATIPQDANLTMKPGETSAAYADRVFKEPDIPPVDKKLPVVNTEETAQQRAETMTNMGGKGGVKGFVDNLKGAFQRWVNTRDAKTVDAYVTRQQFSDLSKVDPVRFQSEGFNPELKAKVQAYVDKLATQEKAAGIDYNKRQEYIAQYWVNPPSEVQAAFRRLGLSPGFTKEALYPNYAEGVKAGLTPRYNNVADVLAARQAASTKAIADREFFNFIAKEGLIQPHSKASPGWQQLQNFPNIGFTTDLGKEYSGGYYAPPELAKIVNNYLGDPDPSVASFAKFASATKQIVLTAGIPKTGLNIHGFNMAMRYAQASDNPVSGLVQGLHWLVNPSSAEAKINENLSLLPIASRDGLKLGVENNLFNREPAITAPGRSLAKYQQVTEKYFSDPLFQKIIPAMKIERWKVGKQYLMDHGVPEEQAGKQAARATNGIMSGINWAELGRSRTMNALKQSVILAPDWAESQVNIARGIGEALLHPTNPQGHAYRLIARNLVGTFAAMAVANKLTSGHWPWQNDAGHTFEVQVGYTPQGQKRYVRPFGTADDFVRLPYETAVAIASNDYSALPRLFSARLSTPLATVGRAVFNTDYQGNPILGKDKYGNQLSNVQQAGGVANLVSGLVAPQQIQQGINYATNRSGPEQAITGALELPLRYSSLPQSQAKQQLTANLQKAGVGGQQIYDTLHAPTAAPGPGDPYKQQRANVQQLQNAVSNGSITMQQAQQAVAANPSAYKVGIIPPTPKVALTPNQVQAKQLRASLIPTRTRLSVKKGKVAKMPKIKATKATSVARIKSAKVKPLKFKTSKIKTIKVKKLPKIKGLKLPTV